MDHPIDRNYLVLRRSDFEEPGFAYLIQKSTKSGLLIGRSVTQSLLVPSMQLVCRTPGQFRVEQLTVYAPDIRHSYGTLIDVAWGILTELLALWRSTNLEVKMPQDTDFWDAYCESEWDPQPLRRTGYLWTVQMVFEAKAPS
jgi:hypothetical protein